jgi:diguanylate cyclase (GGDEF)-like protein
VERLKRALAEAEAENRRLAQLVIEDPLTGVLNRRGFDRELDRAIAYLARYQGEASLVAFDLDGFKAVNDTHGHSAGDDLLRSVAASLKGMIRASDTLARVGGDEFMLILWQAGVEAAAATAERLAAALPIPAAWGVAAVEGADRRAVLARADAALYAMKRRMGVRR